MTRQLLAGALSAWLLLALAGPVGAQPSFRWWQSPEVQKDLGLTADQVSRIDEIFRTTMARQRKNKDTLDLLEERLSTLIEADADEDTVVKQVDKVEATRATLNKERTLMLLHMRQVLTPAQRATYSARVEQWQREHPRPRNDLTRPGSGRGQQQR
jgi:Spy/CpxP family protein refolding chaperone